MPSPQFAAVGPPHPRSRPRAARRSRQSRRRAWSSLNPQWKSRAILRNLYERSAIGIRISNASLHGAGIPRTNGGSETTRRTGLRTKVLARTRNERTPRWGMKREELLELMQTRDDAWNKQDSPVC